MGIRYVLLKTIAQNVGSNVGIYPGVYLLNPENITIGENVSIHPMCYIDAAGQITIGNNVSIAHGVTIMSSTHSYKDQTIPIKDQKILLKKTVIKDNVWIGSKATIVYGLSVGAGSIVGASAVVTKNVSPNSVVAGIPAQQIKNR